MNCFGSDFVILKDTNFIWRLKFRPSLVDKVYILLETTFYPHYLLPRRFRDRHRHHAKFKI